MVLRERTASIRSVEKACSGGGQKAGLFLSEDIGEGAVVAASPAALVRVLVAPELSLAIAFGQRGKSSACPERVANIADSAFHAAFLIAGAHLARPWSEVIMRAQLDQPRVKLDLIAAAFQHRALEIVVKNYARLPVPVGKSMHVAAQEILHGLIEEELQIQGSRIRQRHHEAGQGSLGAAHHYVPKVGPIDLRLHFMVRIP